MSQNIIQLTSQPQFVMSTNTTTTQGGKISLVPTNFLLKSQTQTQQQQQQQQKNQITFKSPQIMYTSRPNGTATTNSMQVPIQTTGSKNGMPMKVLLVNRLQQNPQQTSEKSLTTSPSTPPLTPFQMRPPPNMRPILPKPKTPTEDEDEPRSSPRKPFKYPFLRQSGSMGSSSKL